MRHPIPPRETVADQIARILGERIMTGELAPGVKLRQDHIATQFEASHVPVREALQKLEARGLAVSLPRRGMRVAPLDEAAMKEVVEMRAALEVVALRHAAPNLNAVAYLKIEDALAACDTAQTLLSWDAANRAFHRALIAPCQMPRLLATLDDLQITSSRYVFNRLRSARWRPHSSHDHRQIVDALRARDISTATALLQRHILTLERLSPGRETANEA